MDGYAHSTLSAGDVLGMEDGAATALSRTHDARWPPCDSAGCCSNRGMIIHKKKSCRCDIATGPPESMTSMRYKMY
ncbi:hypothetical protein OIU74_010865 [Salix koriyanagi]|uniref:Uncharacterized protein n=1 Tax=Salix koriyanagi TaxID=2511006 RepID=A0A9Q0TDX3_9ROSI|nr:hypothetical protein OIU74_010865 [Salix koriyanagi]